MGGYSVDYIRAMNSSSPYEAVFLPLTDLSGTTASVLGGWMISSVCKNPDAAMKLLYLMATDETLARFFLVIVIGLLAATLLWYSQKLSEITEPYLVILNSLPKSALAPLFIVWLGTGSTTIVVAGISVALFGSIISFYTGFQQVDSEKITLIYTLGGHKGDAFRKVILPGSIPIMLSTTKVNIGLALVGVIIGEFLAARRGLGYLIIYGSQVFQLNLVITSILILCVIAMGFYKGIQCIEHHIKKQLKM